MLLTPGTAGGKADIDAWDGKIMSFVERILSVMGILRQLGESFLKTRC